MDTHVFVVVGRWLLVAGCWLLVVLLVDETTSSRNHGNAKNRNVFGTWSESGGLSVESPNVCERRKDLGDVQLRDAIMPYAKLTKLYFDTNENIIGTGGVYQVIRIIQLN